MRLRRNGGREIVVTAGIFVETCVRRGTWSGVSKLGSELELGREVDSFSCFFLFFLS